MTRGTVAAYSTAASGRCPALHSPGNGSLSTGRGDQHLAYRCDDADRSGGGLAAPSGVGSSRRRHRINPRPGVGPAGSRMTVWLKNRTYVGELHESMR